MILGSVRFFEDQSAPVQCRLFSQNKDGGMPFNSVLTMRGKMRLDFLLGILLWGFAAAAAIFATTIWLNSSIDERFPVWVILMFLIAIGVAFVVGFMVILPRLQRREERKAL